MDEEQVLTPKELVQLIDRFLAERTESEDSGFARVTQQDMHDLSEIVYKVIEAKWGRDADGDLPVKYDLTDWTKYQSMWWQPVPHPHDDLPGHIEAVVSNLKYASDQSDKVMNLLRYFNKDMKPIAEYVAEHHPDFRTRYDAEKFLHNWFRGENND